MGEFSDQDHDAILAIHDRWIAEEIAGNGLAVLQYCTDDVRWLVPGGREVVGKDAKAGQSLHRGCRRCEPARAVASRTIKLRLRRWTALHLRPHQHMRSPEYPGKISRF